MADAPKHDRGSAGSASSGLTRRDLLKQQAAAGAGILATDVLLGGPFAGEAAAAGVPSLHPQFYPLTSFSPSIDLRGKIAVITGASTGIGRAAGEALAARGVHVIGTSRDVASVRDRPAFTLLNLDITKSGSIDAFVTQVMRRLGTRGRVDILINNAGRGIIGNPLPPDGGEARYFAQLELGYRTDYAGHVMVTKRMLPLLPRRGYARVYFTVSIGAYSVATNALAPLHGYIAMKRALLAYANAWRSTLVQARSHITVATVNPYTVNTRWPFNVILTEKAPSGSAMSGYLQAVRRSCAKALPASLVGEAYRQLLSTTKPPANVAAGSAAEPYATMASNSLYELDLLVENGQAAIQFGS